MNAKNLCNLDFLKIAIDKLMENYAGDFDEFKTIEYLFEIYQIEKNQKLKAEEEK